MASAPPVPPRPNIPALIEWQRQSSGLRRDKPKTLMDLLIPIDDAVGKYHAAFSPMAKRNLAVSMLHALEAWIKAWKSAYPLAVPKEVAALEKAARFAGASAVSGSYADAVCIGYVFKTGAFDANKLVKYDGLTGDKADMIARCASMRGAIREAFDIYQLNYGSKPGHDAAGTLKIFMAPEFYFRGRYGAYEMEVAADVMPLLRDETKDAKYRDWLFIFGTVIIASFVEETKCPRCNASGKDLVKAGADRYTCSKCRLTPVTPRRIGASIDNAALIQKGGEADHKNSYIIQKEYISHIDFRRVGPPVLPSWTADRTINVRGANATAVPVPGSRDLHSSASSRFTDERMGGSIFTIDGITFGMEICLDHAKNRLSGASNIQIHLVPSAGMGFQRFACIPGGLFFNVDGLRSNADMRVNDASAPKTFMSAPVKSGGAIQIFPPAPIPWPG
jgi:ribosomal protein S27AE